LACRVSGDSAGWVMLMSVLLSVRPALSHSGSGRSCSVETSSWSMWRILRRRDHRIRTSTGRHRGGTSGGTLVFTQVRPRPPESFRPHFTSMVSDEPSNVESQQCSRRARVGAGRLIEGWSYPSSEGLGNSEGLRPSGCPLQSSAGRSGMSWSARSAIANGRPPRRSTQREANREDVLSLSFIPSGPRSA